MRTLRGMKCVAHIGYRDRPRADYVVHETVSVVFIHGIEPERGHPL